MKIHFIWKQTHLLDIFLIHLIFGNLCTFLYYQENLRKLCIVQENPGKLCIFLYFQEKLSQQPTSLSPIITIYFPILINQEMSHQGDREKIENLQCHFMCEVVRQSYGMAQIPGSDIRNHWMLCFLRLSPPLNKFIWQYI